MNRSKIFALAVTATTLPASGAFAEEQFYLQGSLGFNQLFDTDQTGSSGPGGAQANVASDFDGGYNLGIAVGTKIPAWSGVRAELALSYSENDADSIDFSGNGAGEEGNVQGDISSTSIFANLLYDIKTPHERFTPYIGAGIGAAFIDSSVSYGGLPVRINDDDEVFAAQLIAGVAYKLNDRLDLTFDARYSRAFDVELTRVGPAGPATVSDDFDNLSLNVGLRFGF
ncbi:outer membrane protein [Roseovarius sp. EL26]|uniref:outer membrane protein n=1 Tax=Roseovarius sp. EL26 TaxID=2126672 RepID=UPI000EA221DB|nr:outer membrane beta-barrel protein [Roseovarius sp. EL26]